MNIFKFLKIGRKDEAKCVETEARKFLKVGQHVKFQFCMLRKTPHQFMRNFNDELRYWSRDIDGIILEVMDDQPYIKIAYDHPAHGHITPIDLIDHPYTDTIVLDLSCFYEDYKERVEKSLSGVEELM